MSRSSAALTFVSEAIARYGEPVPGADEHVRVRLSQQELARQNDCAPSTIAWYLRRLGPAVVSRRGGLTFDRAALQRLSVSCPRLAPRTAAVEQELVTTFARPAADGTRVEVDASLQDLATHFGMNRSSAHRHVSALEHAGRLQRRGRRLYLVDRNKEPTVNDPPDSPSHVGAGVSSEQVLELLDKVTDVMASVADIALHLLAASAANAGAHDPRFSGAQTADHPGLRAAAAADHGRGISSEPDLIDRTDSEITSDQSSVRAAESREPPEVRADEPRIDGGPDWKAEDLPVLLRPLLEECDHHGLPGVTDARRVIDSLARFDAEQVAGAARQMAADLRSGAPMRSPIAILVRKADAADPYYFRAQEPEQPPAAPPVVVDNDEPADEEAQAAVASLDAGALAALDDAVVEHVQRLLGHGLATSAMSSPATLEHWRPIVWRAAQHRKDQP